MCTLLGLIFVYFLLQAPETWLKNMHPKDKTVSMFVYISHR